MCQSSEMQSISNSTHNKNKNFDININDLSLENEAEYIKKLVEILLIFLIKIPAKKPSSMHSAHRNILDG